MGDLTKAQIYFLRRLADSDGQLQRYQIDPECDISVIVSLEAKGLLDRELKLPAMKGSKLLRVTLTAAGLAALSQAEQKGETP